MLKIIEEMSCLFTYILTNPGELKLGKPVFALIQNRQRNFLIDQTCLLIKLICTPWSEGLVELSNHFSYRFGLGVD